MLAIDTNGISIQKLEKQTRKVSESRDGNATRPREFDPAASKTS
jgi:hypothetical protein